MDDDEELREGLAPLRPAAFSGRVWRHVFGDRDPCAVNVRGARWNPPGTTALYTGCTWDAAVAEGDHLVAMQPFRPTARRWVYSFDVKLARVLDLTDMALLADLGVGFPTLSGIDMTHCQRIGGAVAAIGHEGLLVPSARIDAANLVLYVTNFRPDASVILGDPTPVVSSRI